jgi:transcriptional regulator GlxA family with amidase domain
MLKPDQQLNVAILIYPRVEMIDMICPMDTFNKVNYNITVQGHLPRYNIYTVAESQEPIYSQEGLVHITPAYAISNCPSPDIIVVPGLTTGPDEHNKNRGYGTGTKAIWKWLQQMNNEGKQILSVCIGAFILEAAGLLDGKPATTHYAALQELADKGAKKGVQVIGNVRYVDSSANIVTAAGLTSGIAGALHIIEKFDGSLAAQQAADMLMYNQDVPLPQDTLTSLFIKPKK